MLDSLLLLLPKIFDFTAKPIYEVFFLCVWCITIEILNKLSQDTLIFLK